jgi:anti-sigma regulatory factor (Ser/Thr protein kinase)
MQDTAIGSGEHVVHFYEHDTELVAAVGTALTHAAQAGEVALVIATEAHRRAFESDDLAAAERFSDTEVAAKFPAGRDAPGRARRLLAAALRQWGYEGVLVDCAVLVSSELGTNAVLHAGSPFSLTAWMRDSVLRIAVEDASPLGASGHDGGLIPQAGHGLAVVETLATNWGVEGTPEGKVVWAEFRV